MDAARLPPQPKERGSVSRSTVATKDARDFSTAWFQAELLRVTDPRSGRFAQLAETLADSIIKKEHFCAPLLCIAFVFSFRAEIY
jgi:hypothetical protein